LLVADLGGLFNGRREEGEMGEERVN